uniref:Aspartate carbamoyltransferase regulatory chain n=1 Tax=Fervidicoccus fontis TaxID=683846 RepID=A0A7J3ZKC4_9CREN
MSEKLTVSKIRHGTVIDHIPAGRALTVLRILKLTDRSGLRIAVLMNVESMKLGIKDIVKIDGKVLDTEELNKIALVAPTATINIIRDYKVESKFRVQVPKLIEGLVNCVNATCITNKEREPATPRFALIADNPVVLQCLYCGRYLKGEDIVRQLVE